MANNTSDDELREHIALWRWGGDAHRYLHGDSISQPSERAIVQIDEIMALIKQREEQVALEARIDELNQMGRITFDSAITVPRTASDNRPPIKRMNDHLSTRRTQLTTTHKGDQ